MGDIAKAIFDWVKAECAVMKGAPLATVIVFVLGVGGGFWLAREYYRERVEVAVEKVAAAEARANAAVNHSDERIKALEERIRLKDEQVEDARRRLTDAEKDRLSKDLSGTTGKVTIKTPLADDPFANDLKDVFARGGWAAAVETSAEGLDKVEIVGEDSAKLRDVIESLGQLDHGVAQQFQFEIAPAMRIDNQNRLDMPFLAPVPQGTGSGSPVKRLGQD